MPPATLRQRAGRLSVHSPEGSPRSAETDTFLTGTPNSWAASRSILPFALRGSESCLTTRDGTAAGRDMASDLAAHSNLIDRTCTNDVCDQPHRCTDGNNHRIVDLRQPTQEGLDLGGLDSESTDVELIIQPAEEVHYAVHNPHTVTGSIPSVDRPAR